MDFNFLDILIAIPLLVGIYQGYSRGVIHEVLMIIGLVIAIYFAYRFSDISAQWILSVTDKAGAFLPFISFLVTFLTVILAFVLLSKILSAVISISGLGFFNKIFGGIFGGLKFAVILSIVLVFLLPVEEQFDIIGKKTKKESLLFRPLVSVGLIMQPKLFYLKELLQEKLKDLDDFVPGKDDDIVV